MWKPIAAGLMCLGLVTLGIAALRAQEEESRRLETDVVVIEGQPEGEPVAATRAENAVPLDETREATVEIVTEDNRLPQDLKRAVNHLRASKLAKAPVTVLDPGTREALEKLIADLTAEAKRLDEEGKKDESSRKLQSVQALQGLLNPGQRWTISTLQAPHSRTVRSRLAQVDENSRAGQELKKLHARLTELRNQAAINQDAEAHVKIQQEIAELHKKLSGAQWQASGAVAGHPGGAGVSNAYNPYVMPGAGVPTNIWGQSRVSSSDPPEAAALSHKAVALQQAAAQLQQAGLAEQSADLRKQAETLQAQAEKIRAQARSFQHVFAGVATGPAVDLQRSIQELQEQIQQLRKEIGELRELLQKPRQ